MDERKERCETCRFWKRCQSDVTKAEVCEGLCRRFPPIVSAQSDEDLTENGLCYTWPKPEGRDWCGEWQGKRSTQPLAPLLRLSEVQQLLLCSLKDAKAIMRQMEHVVIGANDIRVTESAVTEWIQKHTQQPKAD